MSYSAYKVTTVKAGAEKVEVHTKWDDARNVFWSETGPIYDENGNPSGFDCEVRLEVVQVEVVDPV